MKRIFSFPILEKIKKMKKEEKYRYLFISAFLDGNESRAHVDHADNVQKIFKKLSINKWQEHHSQWKFLVPNQYTTVTGEILEQGEITKYINQKDVMTFLDRKYDRLKLSKKKKLQRITVDVQYSFPCLITEPCSTF